MFTQRFLERSCQSQKMVVLDTGTRNRRLGKYLELLESDNYHNNPLPSALEIEKSVVQMKGDKQSKQQHSANYYREKYGKSFSELVATDQMDAHNEKRMSYLDASAEDTSFPARHFCTVCGFESIYVCTQCGAKFCSLSCQAIHVESRCVKWLK